ncbi:MULTISPECIES: cobalamin B12-binding domain-containing protein [Clostridium]|uniref:Methionine synthase n=2 Tax=Clostridium TaxID=1485 RepID=D8GJH5_CLOLD|nr:MULTISPECIES: cobalamin-dependent protein [Clostridium]ADK15136.1 putative corrinoid protein [Clostridium ljungdahlii DSM 13528]ALU34581.1 Methionine synthase [Clostridium autoethanogenum DSM 10061]OAA88613.1 Methionine synthase [Clostridium ljungdahlii DSM 13528]OAA95041.1 Methionine synthase [Clostridium coskatii]OBR94252.1 methionine synthase [Clostridium coskatii]
MSKVLIDAMAELDEDLVIEEVNALIKANVPVMDIVGYLQKGIEIVGKRFQEKRYFMSELIISGEIFKEVSQILKDLMPSGTAKHGVFVMGTIYGDIHDVGKNIVCTAMSSNDFKVIDLGTDVSTEKFIKAIKEYHPKVVAISCLLTNCFENLKECIQSIRNTEFGKEIKILIGGGVLDKQVCEYVKADFFPRTIQETVQYCKEIYGMKSIK